VNEKFDKFELKLNLTSKTFLNEQNNFVVLYFNDSKEDITA